MAEKYLRAVACRGDLEAVTHCLANARPAVDGARTRGRTALWEAAARGHAAVCAALIAAGASPAAEDWSGATPLQVAARRGRGRAVAAFVAHGCATSKALEAAAVKGHDDIVHQLIRGGARPTARALMNAPHRCFALLCDACTEDALYDALADPACRSAVAKRAAAHLDQVIEGRSFGSEDERTVQRTMLEDREDDDGCGAVPPGTRRAVAAFLRRDVADGLADAATRWVVLARVAALCKAKEQAPFELEAQTRSFVDGEKTLDLSGFNDGGDPLLLRDEVEELLISVAQTADATEDLVQTVCALNGRKVAYETAPRAALLLRACVARFRYTDEDQVVAGGSVTFGDHADFCDATLALCAFCDALEPQDLPLPPQVTPPPPRPDWCPAGAPVRRVHDRRLSTNFVGGGPARVHRRKRRPPLQHHQMKAVPTDLGRGELLDFYDGGYGLVVVRLALEGGCTCEFRLKGPVPASTLVNERLREPVLALPEAPPVNFEDLSFVDHPPTAATLLLLADEPVSEDEDFY